LEVWRLAPLCLMGCIWREWNPRRFENREISLVELKNIMFKSHYIWIVAYSTLQLSSFFLIFWTFVHFLSNRGFLLYTSCVLGLYSCAFSNEIELLIKKYILSRNIWIYTKSNLYVLVRVQTYYMFCNLLCVVLLWRTPVEFVNLSYHLSRNALLFLPRYFNVTTSFIVDSFLL
jgi:hypothetical protein